MTDTLDHSPTRETLWVTDAELIRRIGVPERIARTALGQLDRQHRQNRFPQKQQVWGNRRYWPAVKQWLDANNGLKMDDPKRRTP